MSSVYDTQFKSINQLEAQIYELCVFENCDFSSADFSGMKFIDCTFLNCNLSLVKILHTAFQNVEFEECKMLGLHFEQANLLGFEIHVKQCNLEASCFYQLNLKGSSFEQSDLRAVDFSESNLEAVKVTACDLFEAVFDRTGLFKTDFRNSVNVQLDPERNKLKAAYFNSYQLVGLLGKYGLKITE